MQPMRRMSTRIQGETAIARLGIIERETHMSVSFLFSARDRRASSFRHGTEGEGTPNYTLGVKSV